MMATKLNTKQRAIIPIAALANIRGVNSQLQAHFSISLNNNLTLELLYDFVSVLDLMCSPEVAQNAQSVLEQVLKNNN